MLGDEKGACQNPIFVSILALISLSAAARMNTPHMPQ
jgi:hypothetical protein